MNLIILGLRYPVTLLVVVLALCLGASLALRRMPVDLFPNLNLPVIYDASHAFGVRQGGESLLSRGHMSIVSFHATKVFHSAEGGAVICPDAETKQAIDRLCNHGITDETTVDRIGLNAKMSELLGLDTRGNFQDGPLQDVHWPEGLFGYFPCYSLGAMFAAQWFATMRRELPDLDARIAVGDLQPIFGWLHERIWSQASRWTTDELAIRASGEPLNPAYFKAHLEARYLKT